MVLRVAPLLADTQRECKHCHCLFTPKHSIQVYHNKSCRQKAVLAKNRAEKLHLAEQIAAAYPAVTASLVTKKYGASVRVSYAGRVLEVLDQAGWESIVWAWGLEAG